ncbi:hypothetical protein RD792_001265 [Penstemon davidsonii]|uniref:Alpha-1,3-glucosyltransferase n=1 Tax=Penstemon davidsonii TaxID=160366 RepID=A0ABR0DNK6_9LAMI|nr:hypothetical protein RD792_001265 [Penstemon davidsonii]
MEAARGEAETVIFSAIDSLMHKTGITPKDIDILIVNCSLFSPTPSLSAMVVNKYKLRSNIKSFNLSGMGCSAGLISIDLARDLLQMSAYYAPAFFGYLLGKCLKRQNPILEILKLGLVVLGTFAVLWWPYLYSVDASLEVLSRLAPFERGLYEDYVANFWCTTSVVLKWKRLFTTQSLKLLCLAATISTCLPSMIQLVRFPSKRGFLHGLLNCSFSFYLFSFQVHEKSILLPLLPASLLAFEEPFMFRWLIYHALLSIFPLLRRDKLVLPYAVLYGLFGLLYYTTGGRKDTTEIYSFYSTLKSSAFACSIFLHMIYMTVTPPEKYPFLFEAVIMLFCFSQFFLVFIYSNSKQWALSKTSIQEDAEKKRL